LIGRNDLGFLELSGKHPVAAWKSGLDETDFQDAIDAIADCASRLHRLEEQFYAIVPNWSMAQ
jgi:hypothetical protein